MMMKRLFLLVTLLLIAASVQAQGAPEQINAAYADLSQRLGVELNTQNTNWRWEQQSFGDTSLGCPRIGEVYSQVVTPGYIFTITYNGITYDYRVSADQRIVRLCSETAEGTPTATPEDAPPPYSTTWCPAPEGEAEQPIPRSRLAPELQGQALSAPVRLRGEANINAPVIADISPQAIFRIMTNFQCDLEQGLLWWQINYDGITGWVAETQDGAYQIAPMPPLQPVVEVQPITAQNGADLVEVARVQGNWRDFVVWTPDSSQLVVAGDRGSEGIWVYNTADLQQPPRLVVFDQLVTSLAMQPGGLLLAGTNAGGTHLLDIRPDATLTERLFLKGHERDTIALTFHPDGTRYAAAGFNAATNAAVNKDYAIVLWNIEAVQQDAVFGEHNAQVVDMAFNTDGSILSSVDMDGALIQRSIAGGESRTVAGAFSSIAYSPNGQFFAAGQPDGTVRLYDAVSGAEIGVYTGHLGAVTELSFHPNSGMLASVSADGVLRLWDTQTDSLLALAQISDEGASDVAFSPDGRFIAATGLDRTVRFYGVPAAAG